MQTLVVLLIIVAAVGYLGWRWLSMARVARGQPGDGCSAGCGCSTDGARVPKTGDWSGDVPR